jgi:beta-glucanase (GH16 family)
MDGLKGTWPAFWLFSGGRGGTPWNELDFFEIYKENNGIYWKFSYYKKGITKRYIK